MSDLMLVRHHAHTGKLSMSETKHRFTGIGSLLETLYTGETIQWVLGLYMYDPQNLQLDEN